MSKIKFGVCEFGFPCWGPSAIRMAHEAGFEGIQLADCGGTDKSYPLTNKWIQWDHPSVHSSLHFGAPGLYQKQPALTRRKDRHGKHKEGDYRSL